MFATRNGLSPVAPRARRIIMASDMAASAWGGALKTIKRVMAEQPLPKVLPADEWRRYVDALIFAREGDPLTLDAEAWQRHLDHYPHLYDKVRSYVDAINAFTQQMNDAWAILGRLRPRSNAVECRTSSDAASPRT